MNAGLMFKFFLCSLWFIMDINIVKTNRGNKSVICDGYQYRIDRILRD